MISKRQLLGSIGANVPDIEDCKPNFKVPYGWRLVPAKMTDAMENATYKELSIGSLYGFKGAYSAMLSVAPEHKP